MTTGEQWLQKRYGKKGSAKRDKLEEEVWTLFYGELLKEKRKKLKLTQKEVAEKIGKTRAFISQVETGRDVRLSNFVTIAHALDMNLFLKDVS